VLLVPNEERTAVVDAYITWAYREAVPGPPDPYLIWQLSKQGNKYARRADADRALWRDLDALINEQPTGPAQANRPAVFVEPPQGEGLRLRVQALGFDQDGKTKDTQLVSGLTPEVFDLIEARSPDLRIGVGNLRGAAETVGGRLGYAAKKAWAELTGEKLAECAWSREAMARYWPLAEDEFWQRLADRNLDKLIRVFRLIAEPIYDEVTKEATASRRGAKAVEMARIELYGGRPRRADDRRSA
jgi:CRISPR system Cascade subunit CasA